KVGGQWRLREAQLRQWVESRESSLDKAEKRNLDLCVSACSRSLVRDRFVSLAEIERLKGMVSAMTMNCSWLRPSRAKTDRSKIPNEEKLQKCCIATLRGCMHFAKWTRNSSPA